MSTQDPRQPDLQQPDPRPQDPRQAQDGPAWYGQQQPGAQPAPGGQAQAPRYPEPGQDGQPGQYPPQGQYGQPSRYGTQAYDPSGGYDRTQEPPKHRMLLVATLVSLGLYLLSSVLTLFSMPGEAEVRRQLEESGVEIPAAELDAAVSFSQIVNISATVATLAVGLALYLIVYLGLKKVKNWARVLGIVFAILSTIGSLGTALVWPIVAQFTGMESSLVLVYASFGLTVAVNVWWLVLAFNRDVAGWFAAHSRR